ncbi:hypothetical protein E0493_22570 [Roseomonas sp. M0104]|uniref:Uncharacterized protein n=1 Tax=Teichococcus coralli TaxID=2545983 RepID=A0A845BIX5_9PROT|nr:hypothetical protein [Pseudoroseomonas coralli]MXP66126.1 hypothetical protein [Pseudoroseomonas coralli]
MRPRLNRGLTVRRFPVRSAALEDLGTGCCSSRCDPQKLPSGVLEVDRGFVGDRQGEAAAAW